VRGARARFGRGYSVALIVWPFEGRVRFTLLGFALAFAVAPRFAVFFAGAFFAPLFFPPTFFFVVAMVESSSAAAVSRRDTLSPCHRHRSNAIATLPNC
jgi:hypothetical protein